MKRTSCVYLIGAGPGDPELLTVKALRLLQEVDVVVYDRLVSNEIRELIPAGVTRIYAGKRDGHHHMDQDDINQLLVKLARSGHKVARLKGGDPFMFGRGSEEALHLIRHGIDFEVVPGITAATACSAYAGIPLTHRQLARGVQFVTGHCKGDEPLELDWWTIANPETTLVIYMGLKHLPQICRELRLAGLSPTTPAAVIEKGTQPDQRRCLATLATLPAAAAEKDFHAPALIIIGRVVSLALDLDWFTPVSGDEDPVADGSTVSLP